VGHTFAQVPQPIHRAGSICDLREMVFTVISFSVSGKAMKKSLLFYNIKQCSILLLLLSMPKKLSSLLLE
jgi:hypothetical protein